MRNLLSKLFNKKQETPKCNERVTVTLFIDNKYEMDKYFKLFKFMLRDRLEKVMDFRDQKEIITDEFRICILKGSQNARGRRSHYVINMVQDKDFNALVAKPIERDVRHKFNHN